MVYVNYHPVFLYTKHVTVEPPVSSSRVPEYPLSRLEASAVTLEQHTNVLQKYRTLNPNWKHNGYSSNLFSMVTFILKRRSIRNESSNLVPVGFSPTNRNKTP